MIVDIEFLGLHPYTHKSGIGRYVTALQRHLSPTVSLSFKKPRLFPMTPQATFLRNLPVGIKGHQSGSIVHFPQIAGCALMLWNPQHPSVATVHDLGVLELPEEWNGLDPLGRLILRLSLSGLKGVDYVVAVSEFTRRSLVHRLGLPPDRVVTIHPGIDQVTFRSQPDARVRLSQIYPQLVKQEGPWLLYVGSELPRKNLAALLKTLPTLHNSYPGLVLLKVGHAGAVRFRSQTMIDIRKLGLEDSVFFFSDIGDEELALFYSAADILVQPSKLEGFGFPVLEAMACGTPVVCSRSGSLPEVAGDAALYFESESKIGLAERLNTLLADSDLRRELGVMGRRRARLFDWPSTAEATAVVYHQAARVAMTTFVKTTI